MEKDFENARQCQVGCPFQRSVSVEVLCLRSGRFQSLSFADVRKDMGVVKDMGVGSSFLTENN